MSLPQKLNALTRRLIAKAQIRSFPLQIQLHTTDNVWHKSFRQPWRTEIKLTLPDHPDQVGGWKQGNARNPLAPVLSVPAGSSIDLAEIHKAITNGAALTGTLNWPIEFRCKISGVDHTANIPPHGELGLTTIALSASPLLLGKRARKQQKVVATLETKLGQQEIRDGESLVSAYLRKCTDLGVRIENTENRTQITDLIQLLQRLEHKQFLELAPKVGRMVPDELCITASQETKQLESDRRALNHLASALKYANNADKEGYLDAITQLSMVNHIPQLRQGAPVTHTPIWSNAEPKPGGKHQLLNLRIQVVKNSLRLICSGLRSGQFATLERLDRRLEASTTKSDYTTVFWELAHGDFTNLNWTSELSIGAYHVRIFDGPTTAEVPRGAIQWAVQGSIDSKELVPSHPAQCIGFHTTIPGGVMVSSPLNNTEPTNPEHFEALIGASLPVSPRTCLVDCFGGRNAASDPIAIALSLSQRGLLDTVYITRFGMNAPLPEATIVKEFLNAGTKVQVVISGSSDWIVAIKTCERLIVNDHLPSWVHPQDEQYFIQTWHGAPIKKLGHDAPKHCTDEWYRQTIQRQAQRWDELYTHDALATKRMTHAYESDCPVVEGIAPAIQNALQNPDRFNQIEARRRLNIDPTAWVVAVLPTWFDVPPAFTSDGNARNALAITKWAYDYSLPRSQGRDIIVALRLHHAVRSQVITPQIEGLPQTAQIIDWSDSPDVRDIYLAADLVVSDYSSALTDAEDLGTAVATYRPFAGYYEGYVRGIYENTL